MIVVSDSGPLISLMKAVKLDLLRELYGEIRIPEAVYAELTGNARYSQEAELIRSCSFVQGRCRWGTKGSGYSSPSLRARLGRERSHRICRR